MASASFQLVMRSGPTPGKTFPLDKSELYIGRDVTNDIVINDAEISRKHSRLVQQGSGYILEDLGSTNGTFVNGQRLMGPHLLNAGELVMFGENVGLVYEVSQFDPNATVVSATPVIPPQPPVQRPVSPPPYTPVEPPQYVQQVPQSPVEPLMAEPPKKNNTRTWILAGCGCLVVLICICVVIPLLVDYLDLYCKEPFIGILQPLLEMLGRSCQ